MSLRLLVIKLIYFQRYRLLATSESETQENGQQSAALSDRQIVDDMLLALDLDVTSYRLGLTQVSHFDS